MEIAAFAMASLRLLLAPIGRCWKHCRGVDDYMKILDEKFEELNSRKDDIEQKIKAELNLPRKMVKREVKLWLNSVTKFNVETEDIQRQYGEMRCIFRARIGKKVVQKIDEAEKLYQRGSFRNDLTDAILQPGDVLSTTSILGEEMKLRIEEIWESLMNPEVSKIGVYGIEGVGKTTALKLVNNRILERNDKFDHVIWVTASKDFNIVALQDAIACKLELDLSKHNDEVTRAAKLLAALKAKGRYALILDNLYEAHRLEDVGIPEPTSENGSKLLLTTRRLYVCRVMGCKLVQMGLLSRENSSDLFMNIVGHDVLSIPNLGSIVDEVIEECERWPQAIVATAESLKGAVDYYEWKTALEDLKAYENWPPQLKIQNKRSISIQQRSLKISPSLSQGLGYLLRILFARQEASNSNVLTRRKRLRSRSY